MSLTEKIFNKLFQSTANTIQALKQGQIQLKTQIQAISAQIEALTAQGPVPVPVPAPVPSVTQADLDLIWAELDAIKAVHSAEIARLSAVSVPVAAPVPAPVPVVAEVQAETQAKPKRARVAVKAKPSQAADLSWSDLPSVLKKHLKVMPKKAVHPAFEHVLIETFHDLVKITSNNFDVGYVSVLSHSVPADQQGLKYLIDRGVVDALSKIKPGTEIDLSYNPVDQGLKIDAGNLKQIAIARADVADFPKLPPMRDEDLLASGCPDLISALLKSRGSRARDSAKALLCGTVIVKGPQGEGLEVASTDGYTLFNESIEAKNTDWQNTSQYTSRNSWSGLNHSVILNPLAVNFLASFKTIQDPKLFADSAHAWIQVNRSEFVCGSLIDGQYPNYNKILPKSFTQKITVNRLDLLAAVKDLASCVDKQTQVCDMRFDAGKIMLQAGVTGQKTSIDVPAEYQIRSSLDLISFNHSYLETALNCFSGDLVSIGFNLDMQPALITDNASRTQVMVMPVKP